MAIDWRPKTLGLRKYIDAELARIEELRQRKIAESEIEAKWQPSNLAVPPPPATEIPPPSEAPMPSVETPTRPTSLTGGFRQAWQPPGQPQAPPQPAKPVQPWELPAQWAEQGMGLIGQGISKVPLLPEALEFVSPAFEFITEKLEKPWASFLTTPLRPTGVSYEEWEAPTYVKGLAEFTMPLWWIPWIGWAAKGAKALGVGQKAARSLGAAVATGKAGKVILPTSELLDQTLFKVDPFKRFALWAENKPVLHQAVQAVGGAAAFVRGDVDTPLDIARRAVIKRAVVSDMRHGVVGTLMPRLQKYGDARTLLDVADNGLVRGVTVKDGTSAYLYDVLEGALKNPDNYQFASKEAASYVKELGSVLDEVYGLAQKEGVKRAGKITVHRIVEGKDLTDAAKIRLAEQQGITVEQLEKKLGEGVMERSEFGSLFEVQRHHGTMESGVKAGVKYGLNVNESVQSTINYYIKKIANKRFTDEIGALGKKPLLKFAEDNPIEAVRLTELLARAGALKSAQLVANRLVSYKAFSIPGATIQKIRNGLPEVADQLDRAFTLKPKDAVAIINNLGTEIRHMLKIMPEQFRAKFPSYEGKTLMAKIENAVRDIAKSEVVAERLLERIYKQAYRLDKATWDDALKGVRETVTKLAETTKTELSPLLRLRRQYLQRYVSGGRQILGEAQARFKSIPAFGDKIFDSEVVKVVEKALGDKGQAWLQSASTLSGTSRMLTAALDFSAGFIQGLAVLGRNPVAWAKAMANQFEFFANPQKFYQYMTRPEVMAIATERMNYGGSRSTFEFFEAMRPLQTAVGKIPKVGAVGKKLISQTYGRAEAAFTGFGEVARNEMWMALRRPNMNPDQLRDLARTIDRMTGVMSVEAIGIGRTQQQVENAWVFFAPRYTRASLSYVSDILKGGLTGAEARKSLGSLMASGFAFYYGTSKVLGQQPNLDPSSGKFLTIKIGDSHMGVGGILYGLMRFQSDLAASIFSIGENRPVDILTMSRVDNPFLKFMYQRTAPLTGLTTGLAIEHKDYFGQPFESPADWAKFLAGKVVPIALQTPLESNKFEPLVVGAEVMGGRTFPKSAFAFQQETRDKIALDKFGVQFAALPKLQQRQINRQPEVSMYQAEIDKSTTIRGKTLSVAFLERGRERDDAWAAYKDTLEQYQQAIDAGAITGFEFKELMLDAKTELRGVYQHIDSLPRYKDVLAKLSEPRELNKSYIGDVAFDELMSRLYGEEVEGKYGIYNFNKANQIRDEIRQKYGDDVYNYVETREQEKESELPPMAQAYQQAQRILKPYWAVEDEVIKVRGEPKTKYQLKVVNAMVSRIRKRMRAENPELDAVYRQFYSQSNLPSVL